MIGNRGILERKKFTSKDKKGRIFGVVPIPIITPQLLSYTVKKYPEYGGTRGILSVNPSR